MSDNFFIPTFEHIYEQSIPPPLIKHSRKCKNYNKKRKNIIKYTSQDICVEQRNYDKENKEHKYVCINFHTFNKKCYHKNIRLLDHTHLDFTLGESLMYLLNVYLQNKIITKHLYNRMFYSFQLAIIEVISKLKEGKEYKWNIKGKLINSKKENNIQIVYIENAFLSFKSIVLHAPLLKIKSIDI
ncbi:hypothetical protein PFAG_02603 [Plasmodium falciparum Santa Lucia]|uniref:Uncharacterized protein n=12 Tax=Plasmodium falciparum TaxID=5833 RepID=C0H589_PLAF7|nr:conserved Plasmodium protein, unknown function [Plasmodium falciparum 3D7]ETW18755.1 hypothetical protein PFFVO_02650 [Plasmodium falciparum Vietnam Oak-Knoll (FVO)]ETW36609.1 hypothetical protein PFTANZ_02679 [Plasmodium falciparum Tanzania (2000708)]ETW42880.1 hypothetical protein PFNF135_02774 [Plasmodium falciparum NF135/5.C10]ETW49319.1 hypothetical protein PFMALIP_02638 [Plasmodium falciparum MaliPS096_E11]ETW56825.1 hypothetical protein PFUGPA_01157 [Plasmodium falciparum Palo Alto/U|eukprot:XP_002808986.1 conserved Plasmodium protein, unknown function [Plasmodium falciparum 3D7]